MLQTKWKNVKFSLMLKCRCHYLSSFGMWYLHAVTIVRINMGTMSLCRRRSACVLSQLFFQSSSFWCLLCPSRLWMWLLSEAHLPGPVATTTEAADLCWAVMAALCPAYRWAVKQNSHRLITGMGIWWFETWHMMLVTCWKTFNIQKCHY